MWEGVELLALDFDDEVLDEWYMSSDPDDMGEWEGPMFPTATAGGVSSKAPRKTKSGGKSTGSPAIPAAKGKAETSLTKLPLRAATAATSQNYNCHSGNILVVEASPLFIWGGGISRNATQEPGMLVINLANTAFGKSPIISFGGITLPRLSSWVTPRWVSLPLEDMRAPKLPRTFWDELLADLQEEAAKSEDGLDVLVVCQGGHGRTGVVLSILQGLLHPDDPNPIATVRANYCNKAVETKEQAEYIIDILGLTDDCLKSLSFDRWFYGGAGTYVQAVEGGW